MDIALKMAEKAFKKDEVPVGCVIVKNGKVLSKACNCRQRGTSVDHAEVLAIRKACKKLHDFRLNDCDLYVTLEPCPMCCGAIVNARIKNCFFGAYDKKAGYAKTLYNMFDDDRLNHKVYCVGGFKKTECSEILTRFFRGKRSKNVSTSSKHGANEKSR